MLTRVVANDNSIMPNCSSRAVLARLDECGPIGAPSVAEQLEVHPITVQNRCYQLQSDGYVFQISGGVYCITEDGREYLRTLEDS